MALQIRRTLAQPDATHVHDLRVAIRRFNQALALRPRSERPKRLLRRLKKIMRLAGEVRNADITLNLVAKIKGTKRLVSRLHRRREDAERRLKKALDKLDPREIPRDLPIASATSPAAIVGTARRMFKRAAKSGDPLRLHRIRIAAKKLRYTLELLAPDHPRLETVKRLQSMLGRINDYETAWAIVSEESGGKAVRAQLKQKQAKRIREFHRFWATLFPDPATQREWIREFTAIHSRNVSKLRRRHSAAA
ncbi:MAG TPA: CHAD domain-containing protein [Bryobacteraceae bacterium]|nr:CHAD domain-containing protein [Bryobacteraceae bacterium]